MNTYRNTIKSRLTNYERLPIASLDVDGKPGTLYARNMKSYGGNIGIYFKLKGEKEHRVCTVGERYTLDNVRPLLDEYMELDYVSEWATEFTARPRWLLCERLQSIGARQSSRQTCRRLHCYVEVRHGSQSNEYRQGGER